MFTSDLKDGSRPLFLVAAVTFAATAMFRTPTCIRLVFSPGGLLALAGLALAGFAMALAICLLAAGAQGRSGFTKFCSMLSVLAILALPIRAMLVNRGMASATPSILLAMISAFLAVLELPRIGYRRSAPTRFRADIPAEPAHGLGSRVFLIKRHEF